MRSITSGQTSALVAGSGPPRDTLQSEARPSTPTVKTTVTEVPSRTPRPPSGIGKSRAESMLPDRTEGREARPPPLPCPELPLPVPSPGPRAPVPSPASLAPDVRSAPVEAARGSGLGLGSGFSGAVTWRQMSSGLAGFNEVS